MDHSILYPSTWYKMMKLYKDTINDDKAFKLYKKYQTLHGKPDVFQLNLVMRLHPSFMKNAKNKEDYSDICNFIREKIIHDKDESCEYLISSLLDYYRKINDLNGIIDTFEMIDIKDKNNYVYNKVMQAYLDNGMNDQVIKLFFSNEMYNGNLNVIDDIGLMIALQACSNNKDKDNGKEIHNFIVNKTKYDIRDNLRLFTTLITFYGKIEEIDEAKKIFSQISNKEKDVICYNSMMQSYLDCNMDDEIIKLFFSKKMFYALPQMTDEVSYMIALRACGNMKEKKNGQKIHDCIVKDKRKYNSHKNIRLFTALITFYGKTRELDGAVNIFSKIDSKDKDIICYNAMMQAYLDCDMNKQVIQLFFSNQMFYGSPKISDDVSYMLALKACGNAKSYKPQVEEVGNGIRHNNRFFKDTHLLSQLISCYGKLGYVKQSKEIFDQYLRLGIGSKESIVVFSSMINCYGCNHLANKSIDLFLKLKNDAIYSKYWNLLIQSVEMDDIETVSVLHATLISACSHSQLINEAKEFYDEYNEYYKIISNKVTNEKSNMLEIQRSTTHCALVDSFSRKGLLDEAWQFCLEFENNILSQKSFMALLSGCRKYNDENMARKTLEKIENLVVSRGAGFELLASASVLLQNILTSLGKYDEARATNSRRIRKRWYKRRGISEIVVPGDDIGVVHSFTAGNDYKRDYPNDWKKMDKLLDEWQMKLKKMGFKHNEACMTRQLKKDENIEYVLCRHAEKLALAYGVLRIPNKDIIIHINKNMRMCADCHEATKRIAQIEMREIRVADAHANHVFDGKGNCSCGDYY